MRIKILAAIFVLSMTNLILFIEFKRIGISEIADNLLAAVVQLQLIIQPAPPSPSPSLPPPPLGGGGGGGGQAIVYLPPVTQVIFKGKAYPGSKVILLKDAQITATVPSSPMANFLINVSGLSNGNYLFSLYSEDYQGRRSTLLTYPISVSSGITVQIDNVFIAPIIDVDKSEVKRGDNIAIFGQSAPNSEITIAINSDEEFFNKTNADKNGIYLYNFDTILLTMGAHYTKSKAALSGEISSFGKTISFAVGTKNILTQLPIKTPAKGDLNSDNRVNLVDFSVAAYWYKRPAPPASSDLNNDGKIDLVDFSIMAYYWTG